MPLVLSDMESQRFYRSRSSYRGPILRARDCALDTLDGCIASSVDLKGARLMPSTSHEAIQVLVPKQMRRPSSDIFPRAWSGPTPRGSFLHVHGDIFVCSPEFLAVLIAERTGFYELTENLYELCGTYAVDDAEGLFEHQPLTTVRCIAEFIELLPGVRGVGHVRRALAYVRDGSASPRETQLAMMLALPTGLGGFGLADIQLNYVIDPTEHGETGLMKLRADVALPPDRARGLAGVAMEYESDEWHDETRYDGRGPAGRSRLSNDSMRRRAYVAAGYFAITVTNDEIKDFDELCGIVAQVRRKRGLRREYPSEATVRRRRALHEWLMAPTALRGPEPTPRARRRGATA